MDVIVVCLSSFFKYNTQPYAGVWDGLVRVANEEGVGALWNGTGMGACLSYHIISCRVMFCDIM